MYQTVFNGKQYCFYDDKMTISGTVLQYEDMTNIRHRGGGTPAFVFEYAGRQFALPYPPAELPQIIPYMKKASHAVPASKPVNPASAAAEPVASGPVVIAPVRHAGAPEPVAAPPEPASVAPEQYVPAPEQYAAAPEYYAPAPEPEYVAPVEAAPVAPEQYVPAPEQYAAAPEYYAPAPGQYAAEPELSYEDLGVMPPAEPDYAEPEETTAPEISYEDLEVMPPAEPDYAGPEETAPAEPVRETPAGETAPAGSDSEETAPAESDSAEAAEGASPAPAKRPKKKFIICIALIVAILLACAAGYYFIFGRGYEVYGIEDKVLTHAVAGDNTDSWKYCTIKKTADPEEYALDYYYTCFDDGDTLHWIINYGDNTTTSILDQGEYLTVTVYEHVDGEENSAETLGTGSIISEFLVDSNTEEITVIQ